MDPRHRHVPELQSIRGLAALTVLLHHCSFLFDTSPAFHFYAEALLNAHAAVMIFFVLSGYVLVRSLNTKKINVDTCTRFYIARLFRIYPAMWFACAAAYAYLTLVHFKTPTHFASEWYAQYFPYPPNLADFAKNMAAFRYFLIPPTWSIRVELLASALIPLIAFLVFKRLAVLFLVGSIGIVVLMTFFGLNGNPGGIDYLPSFILGGLIFQYQSQLGRRLGSPLAMLLSVVVLLFFRRLNPGWRFDTDYNALVPVLVESLAAAALIVGIVAHPISVLQKRVIVQLGDISYSLYLIHFIVMSVLAKLIGNLSIDPNIRALLLMIGTVSVTCPLSALSYSYIEKPGILIGQHISRLFTSRLSAKPA